MPCPPADFTWTGRPPSGPRLWSASSGRPPSPPPWAPWPRTCCCRASSARPWPSAPARGGDGPPRPPAPETHNTVHVKMDLGARENHIYMPSAPETGTRGRGGLGVKWRNVWGLLCEWTLLWKCRSVGRLYNVLLCNTYYHGRSVNFSAMDKQSCLLCVCECVCVCVCVCVSVCTRLMCVFAYVRAWLWVCRGRAAVAKEAALGISTRLCPSKSPLLVSHRQRSP